MRVLLSKSQKERITIIDILRGVGIIYVVFYHLMYDLVYLFNVQMPPNTFVVLNGFRDVLVTMLVVVSGISCHLSRSNVKRGIQTLVFAYILTIVTYLQNNDYYVVFGILHMFSFSMIIYSLLEDYIAKIPAVVGIVASGILFFLTFNIGQNVIGIEGLFQFEISVDNYYFYPFGLVSNDFSSSDYYSLFPWFFAFLAGSFVGRIVKQNTLPSFCYTKRLKPLGFIGSHTMIIYLIHQPIIIGVLYIIFLF